MRKKYKIRGTNIMFEDIINEKSYKFDDSIFAGFDGNCIYCPSKSNPHLVFKDCMNYKKDPDRKNVYGNVCKYYVGKYYNCTFHRY